MTSNSVDVSDLRLRPWTTSDTDVIAALNSPGMTEHLGGPEPDHKLSERLDRYANPRGDGAMFVIESPTGESLGSIGFWRRDWQGQPVYETGWAVLPDAQGRGVASSAARLVIEVAAAAEEAAELHAYPRTDHPASNATCRRAGFQLRGEFDFEYPAGHPIRCNDWVVSLVREPDQGS